MTHDSPTTTTFVKDDSGTTIVCPRCYSAKTTSVKQFRNQHQKLRVKCKCGHTFKIELEFRRQYRKSTELPGKSQVDTPTFDGKFVKIVNLSMSGVRFEVHGMHDIQIGQKGTVNFTLDDRKRTVFVKNVVVRSIQENSIGCEFVKDQAYQKELGFYLRP
jgi:hypothetical protein